MITISFYSYKGGVGRSLALTNLAAYLVQFGATVVMVDFDLEAPGLHYKVQPGSTPIEVSNGGLAGLLADVSSSGSASDLDYDLAIDVTKYVESPTPVEDDLEQQRGKLLLIPAGDPLQPRYWSDLARIDWGRLFTLEPRPGVTALARLRDHIVETYEPDLLLVDSRTGITPSAGVSTTLLPDVVVALLLNTPEHLDGSRIVISAIARGDNADLDPPKVLPVLSRYTGRDFAERLTAPELRRRASVVGRVVTDEDAFDEDIPLEEIRGALIQGLDKKEASRVGIPLVLHADVALQQRERLSFGRHAREAAPGTSGTLLDDYVRLFANLVPRETLTRHLSGVRNRVRAIILDRPDDAVRTLENLAGLVGDQNAFIDLIKVHALRRDVRSMLRAADRLFRVHGSIVVEPAISAALREMLVGRGARSGGVEPTGLSAEFLENYWRQAASDDFEWGAGVARALAGIGRIRRAEQLTEDVVETTGDADVLAQLVGILAGGNAESERLAVRLALRHFDLGETSGEFLRSAALACRYQPVPELAIRIADSSGFGAVPNTVAVPVLQAAGRHEEAGAILVETFADMSVDDPAIERLSSNWAALVARNRELRTELQQRNPRIVEMLESFREDLRPSRELGRRYGRSL